MRTDGRTDGPAERRALSDGGPAALDQPDPQAAGAHALAAIAATVTAGDLELGALEFPFGIWPTRPPPELEATAEGWRWRCTRYISSGIY
jgi:hypothetical protein